MLEEGSNNYICSLCPAGERCGLAFADISTGSVLFCQRAAEINDGDLIVVKENGAFALYLYLKDRKVKADGEKRILHNKSKAYAKVLGSFNFYH